MNKDLQPVSCVGMWSSCLVLGVTVCGSTSVRCWLVHGSTFQEISSASYKCLLSRSVGNSRSKHCTRLRAGV